AAPKAKACRSSCGAYRMKRSYQSPPANALWVPEVPCVPCDRGLTLMVDTERALLDDLEVGELAVEYDDKQPEDLLEWAFHRFGEERFALVSSFQAEASVLIDMAFQINPRVRV